MKLSLRSLFGLVAIVAIGICSLLNANNIWFWVLLSSTILLLVIGTLVAIVRTGATRAFWLGFVLIGVAYVVAVSGFNRVDTKKYLLTPTLLEYLYPQIKRETT